VGRATLAEKASMAFSPKRFFEFETVGIATIIFGVLVCAYFAYMVISHW
jgi:hypothetical protein